MCGIYGQFNYQSLKPVAEPDLRTATDTIVHRGPDDEGFFVSGPVGLGFRRLSIIDLSGGHQPMSDRERSVWLVFNGEIYNFRELRAELESRGHVFQTNSDTEAIIHGYKEWGERVFDRLNGMFGLAIWDAERRKLILARDAMGIKPVYYRLQDGALFFGSEIRSLVATSGADLDPVALNLFLRYRYTPSPPDALRGHPEAGAGNDAGGVARGRPDHALVQLQAGAVRARQVIPRGQERADDAVQGGAEEAPDQRRAGRPAAQRRRRFEPAAGADESRGPGWPTYTVGYGTDFEHDELQDAARTARRFSIRTHVSLELTTDAFERCLPTAVASLEEPVAASSIVPMYLICQRARQDVKVALSGRGQTSCSAAIFDISVFTTAACGGRRRP